LEEAFSHLSQGSRPEFAPRVELPNNPELVESLRSFVQMQVDREVSMHLDYYLKGMRDQQQQNQ